MNPETTEAPSLTKRIFWRAAIVLAFPPIIVYTIAARIWTETRSIPLYVRADVGEELDAFRSYWRRGQP